MVASDKKNLSKLKKQVLDLKDDLNKARRENAFLKENIKGVKEIKVKKLVSRVKNNIANASTRKKIAAVAGSALGISALTLLANLAKQALHRRELEKRGLYQSGTIPLQMEEIA